MDDPQKYTQVIKDTAPEKLRAIPIKTLEAHYNFLFSHKPMAHWTAPHGAAQQTHAARLSVLNEAIRERKTAKRHRITVVIAITGVAISLILFLVPRFASQKDLPARPSHASPTSLPRASATPALPAESTP